MSSYPIGTLGGKPILGSAHAGWVFTTGTSPYETTFDLIPEDADALLKAGDVSVTLILDNKAGAPIKVEKLWVIGEQPGDNPHIKKVRVVDRRFWLPYFKFLGRFNMRRNVGSQRVGNLATKQLNPVVPDIWYWPWSLKKPPNGKWKVSEVFEEFMKQLSDFEKGEARESGGHSLSGTLKNLDSIIEVDNLNIDDPGDVSMLRILAMYPNADVYVDETGSYVFFNRNDGSESKNVTLLGPLIVGSGQIKKISNKWQRPRKIEVYFTMEVEVRHDFIPNVTTLPDTRILTNVIPVPDFTASIGGVHYAQHSWVNLNAIINCDDWSNAPGQGDGGKVTHALLEKAGMPYLDLWGALLITGVRQPDADWAARVGALQAHHRRSFQISSQWMSRTLSVKARRAALIDPATGTWAPSEVYCNHSFIGTVRSFFKNLSEAKGLQYCINVPGYPDGDQVPGKTSPSGAYKFTDSSKAAPVTVHVVDGDQGIIHFQFQADPNHMYEAALPGEVVRQDGSLYTPTANWGTPGEAAIAFDVVTDRVQIPKLEADWKAAVILSHVPASPNDKRQLYKVTVEPKDVQGKIPAADAYGGPTWQVRVGPGMEGAKALIAWFDDRAPDIEAIFGIGDFPPDLRGIAINADAVSAPKGAVININELAKSLAAQIWSRFHDHEEGSGTAKHNPEIKPTGWTGAVAHSLTPSGELITTLNMAGQIQEMNLSGLLDSSTRAILMKLPHVDRQ
jgi:hypothetical protein